MLNLRWPRSFLRSVAGLLVIVHGMAWGAGAWVHSADRLSTTVTIEAEHDAKCLVLSNELRCPVCQYAGSLGTPTRDTPALHAVQPETPGRDAFAHRATVDDYVSASPRAPPHLLS
jgi:hypothetical protein